MDDPADPAENRSTVMPIVTALVIVGIALVAFIAVRLFQGDAPPDENQIGRAVVGQNDALQREDYADFQTFTCVAQQGTQNQVLADQRQSRADKGARVVEDVTAIAVTGDRATATVVYHFEESVADNVSTPMTFIRENGEWTVCSPGPR